MQNNQHSSITSNALHHQIAASSNSPYSFILAPATRNLNSSNNILLHYHMCYYKRKLISSKQARFILIVEQKELKCLLSCFIVISRLFVLLVFFFLIKFIYDLCVIFHLQCPNARYEFNMKHVKVNADSKYFINCLVYTVTQVSHCSQNASSLNRQIPVNNKIIRCS